MNKKTILERLRNLKESTNRISNFIEETVHEAYLDTYENSISGWTYDIIYDAEDDKLELIGPRNNSMTMAEYEGTAYCIGSIPAVANLNESVVPDGYFQSLDEEYQKEIIEFYKDEYDYETATIDDVANDLGVDQDYILKECFPKAYEELLSEYIEEKWDYVKNNLEYKVDNALEQHIDYLDYNIQIEG